MCCAYILTVPLSDIDHPQRSLRVHELQLSSGSASAAMSHKVPKPLTPRLPFLLRRRFVVFILPAALVCVAARLLQSWNVYFGVVWVALAAVISIPTVFVARTVHWFWRSKRRAAKLGAVIPPTWEGKKWGNMDVVNYCIEKFNTGYPGESTCACALSPNVTLLMSE